MEMDKHFDTLTKSPTTAAAANEASAAILSTCKDSFTIIYREDILRVLQPENESINLLSFLSALSDFRVPFLDDGVIGAIRNLMRHENGKVYMAARATLTRECLEEISEVSSTNHN